MPRLRVCHVIEAAVGGARRHVLDVLEGLDREVFDLSMIYSARRDKAFRSDASRLEAAGIRTYEVRMERQIRLGRDLTAFFGILGILRAGGFDIVHSHCSKAGFLGRLAAKICRVPLIFHTPHVFPFEMDNSPPLHFFFRHLERLSARFTDNFVLLHPGQKELALRTLGIPGNRAQVIPNGVDLEGLRLLAGARTGLREALGIGAGAPVVGMTGRFSGQKRHEDLVRAAPLVLRRHPDCVFVLVGDGELRGRIEAMIRDMSLQDSFRLTGGQDNPSPFYLLFDILAMPSSWEGLPYSALEAMALERPVLAASVGGMNSLVEPGVSGELFAPGDVAGMAELMIRLLDDPQRRRELGLRAGIAAKTRFSREAMLSSMKELYLRKRAAPQRF